VERVLCFIKTKVFMPSFFTESVMAGIVYLDMLEVFLKPILQEDGSNDVLFQEG
jgi:hypothetical protein